MKHSPEEILKKFEVLPKDIQEALGSADLISSFQEIGKKYSLHVDQIGEIQDEAGLFMLGLTQGENLIKNISERAGITPAQASLVVQDIDTLVFKPIKESLKKIHPEKESARIEMMKEIEEGSSSPVSINQLETKINTPPKENSSLLPETQETADIVSQKLGGVFSTPPQETEKTNSPKQPRPFDPYREPVQ